MNFSSVVNKQMARAAFIVMMLSMQSVVKGSTDVFEILSDSKKAELQKSKDQAADRNPLRKLPTILVANTTASVMLAGLSTIAKVSGKESLAKYSRQGALLLIAPAVTLCSMYVQLVAIEDFNEIIESYNAAQNVKLVEKNKEGL